MKSSLRDLFAAMLVMGLAAAASTQTPADSAKVEAWRKSMSSAVSPGKGCFKATYPSTAWQEVPCAKPPDRFFGPNPGPVGHGIDFEAQTTGLMTSATGSFDTVNVTSEMSNGTSDLYSLQLNSGRFATTISVGALL